METSTNGERFTLVAENISFKDMLDTIAKGMNKAEPFIYASPVMTSVAWRIRLDII